MIGCQKEGKKNIGKNIAKGTNKLEQSSNLNLKIYV
jgi:hypothetical protein